MAELVRRLTDSGIRQLRAYLKELHDGGTGEPPRALLTDPDASEPFEPARSIQDRVFATRLEAARYLAEVFDGIPGLGEDVALWGWLSLFYFDQVCPPRLDGTRSPGRDYRHILEPGYRHGHRHLLGGPFSVYRLHGEEAKLLLCTRLHQENMFHHEVASRQVFISNQAIIRAVNLLYLDSRTQRPKQGTQDSKRAPGTLRRFVDVVQQLDVNYDLYSMTEDAIVGLLPDEFEPWRRK